MAGDGFRAPSLGVNGRLHDEIACLVHGAFILFWFRAEYVCVWCVCVSLSLSLCVCVCVCTCIAIM